MPDGAAEGAPLAVFRAVRGFTLRGWNGEACGPQENDSENSKKRAWMPHEGEA